MHSLFTFEVTDLSSGIQHSVRMSSSTSVPDEFTAKKLVKLAFGVVPVGGTSSNSRGTVRIGNYSIYAS